MSTRRNRLIPRQNLDSRGAPPPRPRIVTIRDLAELRVSVPPEVHETGMSLIVTVGVDGRLQPGLIPSQEVPALKPYQDLTRLQRARGIVSSLEVSNSKQSVVNEVKNQVVSAMIETGIKHTDIQLKIGAQTELVKSKALSQNLIENFEVFSNSQLNQTAHYRAIATKWFESSIRSINEYCLDTLCKNKPNSIGDILLKNSVPKWFYNKFSIGKVSELATSSIDDIFFPKKLSKMITFNEKEVNSLDFIKESVPFTLQLHYLRAIATLYPSKEKDAILYPTPNDFSKHFARFTDLPQVDRTSEQSTILSITIIHLLYCAIPIKALSQNTLILHEKSFIFKSEKIKLLDDILKVREYAEDLLTQKPEIEEFKYLEELSTSLKAQYKEHINTEGYPKVGGFYLNEHLCQIFNITAEERKALGGLIIFDYQIRNYDKTGIKPIFRIYEQEIAQHSSRANFLKALEILKPIAPKDLNFGPANSALSTKSTLFVNNLTKAGFNQTFLSNVQAYLRSFNSQNFQDQAVKIMDATIQARIITLPEISESPGSEADEAENPYADFS